MSAVPSKELVEKLLKITCETGREVVYVRYIDGTSDFHILTPEGGCFPVRKPVVELWHTHPIPRYTPSEPDLVTLWNLTVLSDYPVKMYVVSYDEARGKAIVLETKFTKLDTRLMKMLLKEVLGIEYEMFRRLLTEKPMCITEISEKQLELMKRFKPLIAITKYELDVKLT